MDHHQWNWPLEDHDLSAGTPQMTETARYLLPASGTVGHRVGRGACMEYLYAQLIMDYGLAPRVLQHLEPIRAEKKTDTQSRFRFGEAQVSTGPPFHHSWIVLCAFWLDPRIWLKDFLMRKKLHRKPFYQDSQWCPCHQILLR